MKTMRIVCSPRRSGAWSELVTIPSRAQHGAARWPHLPRILLSAFLLTLSKPG